MVQRDERRTSNIQRRITPRREKQISTLGILGTLAHFRHFSGLSGLGCQGEPAMNEITEMLGIRYPVIQGAMNPISNPEMMRDGAN